MLCTRVFILFVIYHVWQVRAVLYKQLKNDYAHLTRISLQQNFLASNGSHTYKVKPETSTTQLEPAGKQNVDSIDSVIGRADVSFRLRGLLTNHSKSDAALSKYLAIYTLHVELKKVLAHPCVWWKDWKLWVGCVSWILFWLKHWFTPVSISESTWFGFATTLIQCFGINIVVLHLLTYSKTPQTGLEITCGILVLQALFQSVEELKATNVAVTLFLENIDYMQLVADKKRHDEFAYEVRNFIESETTAKVLQLLILKGRHGNEVVLKVVVNDKTSHDILIDHKEKLVAHVHQHVERIEEATNNNLMEVTDISYEDAHIDCVVKGEFECDTMYMDMTLPSLQILVLFLAQTGVWWFYFSAILWNIDVEKINYTFWMAAFIVMQVTMIFNRGDDSVLGNQFPLLQWYALLTNRSKSITFLPADEKTAPIPITIGSLLFRGSLGFFCNTLLREIMAFTIPLMLSMFTEPMDFVVYCVGVNFICTVDDMGDVKNFQVHTAEEESHKLELKRRHTSPPGTGSSRTLSSSRTIASIPAV